METLYNPNGQSFQQGLTAVFKTVVEYLVFRPFGLPTIHMIEVSFMRILQTVSPFGQFIRPDSPEQLPPRCESPLIELL